MVKLNPAVAILLFVVLLTGNIALAQEASTSTAASTSTPVTLAPNRPFITEPTLQKVAQERLTNLAANMSNRMDAAVSRLQNVTDRLTSRLNKLAEEGRNVDAARAELSVAQTKLDEAKRSLSSIDTEVAAFIGSARPKENWQNLKNTYMVTSEAIVAAHQSILSTINAAESTTAIISEISTTTASTTNN